MPKEQPLKELSCSLWKDIPENTFYSPQVAEPSPFSIYCFGSHFLSSLKNSFYPALNNILSLVLIKKSVYAQSLRSQILFYFCKK
jgi:hypothetical protein